MSLLFRLKKFFSFLLNRKMLVKIDDIIFYDVIRDKIIIKRPFKKPIVLHEKFRKNHRTVHLGKNEYSFYPDCVIINHEVVYF